MYCYLESTKNSENSKKMNKSAEKWAKDLNRQHTKEDIQMANKPYLPSNKHHMSLGTCRLKTTMRCFTPMGMAKKKNKTTHNTKCKNVEQQQLSSFLVGMQNGVVWWFLRKVDTHLPYKPAIVLFIYQNKMETYVHMKTCTQKCLWQLYL